MIPKALSKLVINQKLINTEVPTAWSLFQAVETLLKAPYFPTSIVDTVGLIHVDLFLELTMQKRCLNITLSNAQLPFCNITQKQTHSVKMCHWGKSFIIIKPSSLTKTFCHQSSFKTLNFPRTILFDPKDPPIPNFLFITR